MGKLVKALAVAFAQVHHDFQDQEIGAGHDVPAAAGTEAGNHFADHVEVHPRRLPAVTPAATSRPASRRNSSARLPEPMIT